MDSLEKFVSYIDDLEFVLKRCYCKDNEIINIYAQINYYSLTADIYLNGKKIIKDFKVYDTGKDFKEFLIKIKGCLEYERT